LCIGLSGDTALLEAQRTGLSFGVLRLVHLLEWGIALFTSLGYTISDAKRPAMSRHPGHGQPDALGLKEAVIA
jgi:hypothetical protein